MGRDLSGTILVVEDQLDLRQLVCRALEGAGHETLAAGSAAEGFKAAQNRAGAIDLAIVDMVLPGVSGLDLAALFDRECPAIPILYISGHVDSLAMQCIAHRSPDCVLLKPFTPSQLLARVNILLADSGNGSAASAAERRRTSGSGG